MDTAHLVRKKTRLEIRDLTTDILVLVFSLLHGQDIARCTRVCRYFAGLIHSVLHLQYKIELAQNGMVDGKSSILPISQRLQRLRQYASNFDRGVFDYEDISAHPDYVLRMRDLRWNVAVPAESSFSDLYSQGGRSNFYLSVYTPGSAQAGIQSSRCILPIGAAGGSGLLITKWALDGAQDLLVIAEIANIVVPEQLQRRPDEVHFRFYSLSGSKTGGPTPHPAARLPSVNVFAPATETHSNIQPVANVAALHISGQYVIWELAVRRRDIQSVFIDVCNWRTGDVISRLDVGTRLVHVVPLHHPYLLVMPKTFEGYPHLNIYSFLPSDNPSHIVCTLHLPSENLEPDERIVWHEVYSGDRPYTSEGHFHADLSLSMVVLTFYIRGPQGDHETHYLIPRTTFLAQIHAAARESLGQSQTDSGNLPVNAQPEPVSVPWADWGPQGCLRLRLSYGLSRRAVLIPFGWRMPLVVFDGPESESRSASVFVFDICPLAARRRRHVLAAPQDDCESMPELPNLGSTTGVIENVEEVLPGVVDPDCSRIPFVAYRFRLPDDAGEWQFGHTIRSVVMSMAGFTVKFAAAEYERTVQTWTV